MFSNTDDILIWAKKNSKRMVYKLKTTQEVKDRFVELFNDRVNSLMYDENGEERIPVPFESHYEMTDSDEHFIIRTFELPQEIKEAIDRPDVVTPYKNVDEHGKTEDGYEIKAILICGKDENGYYLAGQKFSPKQIVLRKSFNILLENDTFVEEQRRFVISVADSVDCVYTSEGLTFEKYRDANGVFDLSDYYRQASQEEVNTFVNSPVFQISDYDNMNKMVNGVAMRKKIAKIMDLGTLNDINKIIENSAKVEVNIDFNTDNTKIVLPTDKKELKSVMAFLSEEMYFGMFTNYTYLSNSTRTITTSTTD